MTKLLIGLLLTLTLAACAEQANEPYKFGAVLPLTGTNAFYGTFSKAGITLAVEDINANGGINNRPVEVVYEDSGGDKTKATTAAQKLINVDGVDALMTTTTPMSGAVAPVAEENKIPLIYFSATNAFAINKTYVFKDFPDATLQCEKLAQQVKQDGHAAVALFGTDAEFTHFCKQGVEKVMSVTTFEIYPPGETDYRAQLAKIQNGHNTALILSAFSSDCAHALRQLRESGIKATLYSPYQSYTCGSPENSKIYPDLLEGAYGIDVPLNEKTPEFAAFNGVGRERYQDTPGSPGALDGRGLVFQYVAVEE